MGKVIYKITVLNWNKYNGKKKEGHKSTLIANNFCDDPDLEMVPIAVRWLFLAIILTCGDHTKDTVDMSEAQLKGYLGKVWGVDKAMRSLQELRVLMFEKIEPFLKEKKIREEKVKEDKRNSQGVAPAPVSDRSTELNSECWIAYREAYAKRWGHDPVRNAAVNSQISQITKRLGRDAPDVITFFVNHNDSFYVKKAHQIGLCLKDAESLRTQWARGQQITGAAIKNYESTQHYREQLERIDRGEL